MAKHRREPEKKYEVRVKLYKKHAEINRILRMSGIVKTDRLGVVWRYGV